MNILRYLISISLVYIYSQLNTIRPQLFNFSIIF